MDQRTEDFIAAFQIFLDEVVANHREGAQADGDRALAPILHEHLGADPRSIAVVGEEMPAYRFVDLDIALAELQDRDGEAQLLGIGGGEQRNHHSLGELLEMAGRFQQFPVGAVDYASVATGPQSTREAVSFGLRLFSYGASPVAVLQRAAAARYGSITARMEILSPAPGVAAALIAEVRELMVLRSVFRGQVLTLGGSDFEPGVGGITFHRVPPSPRTTSCCPTACSTGCTGTSPGWRGTASGCAPPASTSSAACCSTARRAPARRTPCGICSARCPS